MAQGRSTVDNGMPQGNALIPTAVLGSTVLAPVGHCSASACLCCKLHAVRYQWLPVLLYDRKCAVSSAVPFPHMQCVSGTLCCRLCCAVLSGMLEHHSTE